MTGFSGAKYQGFSAKSEAEEFVADNHSDPGHGKKFPAESFDNEFGLLDDSVFAEIDDVCQTQSLVQQPQLSPPAHQPGTGDCFYFAKGQCFKGSKCTYRHLATDGSLVTVQEPSASKPKFDTSVPHASCGFKLRKKGEAASNATFPALAAGALKGKQNVGLCVKNGEVRFQFNYVKVAIDTIKACILGRRYDPDAKQWVAPLEALPECVALFEHFGRKVRVRVRVRVGVWVRLRLRIKN